MLWHLGGVCLIQRSVTTLVEHFPAQRNQKLVLCQVVHKGYYHGSDQHYLKEGRRRCCRIPPRHHRAGQESTQGALSPLRGGQGNRSPSGVLLAHQGITWVLP